jgi:hypothetical protein
MNTELCIDCIFKQLEKDIRQRVQPNEQDSAQWQHYKKFRGWFFNLYSKHHQRIPCFADIDENTPWSDQITKKYVATLEYHFQPLHKPAEHCPYVLEHLVCKGVK